MTMTTHLLRQLGDRRPVVTALALAACLLGATTAGGQTAAPADSVWLPWLGCWQLVEETGALPDEWADRRSYADRVVVCLNPTTGDNAGMSVEVTTIADAKRVLVETLHADGRPQPVDEATCRGERRDTWSSDGARLFTRSALTCEDDTDRLVSGVGLMSDALTWLDIQLVDAGGRSAVTVRRYRRVGEATTTDAGATPLPLRLRARAREAAHLIATTELSTNDIIEAQDLAEQPVVEALMVETDASFDLDGRGLIELDDAGVPSDVIDLMVALSFPDWFHVDRPASRGGSGGGGFTSADPWGPYGQAGFHDWYPLYASPFGYYYGWSAYDSLYYLNPYGSGVVLTDGRNGGRRLEAPAGRAYAGRGYSSIGAREPSQVSERRARRRGSDGGTASVQSARGRRSGGSTSSTSQGGGRATSGGYNRGGSTGRTARPR